MTGHATQDEEVRQDVDHVDGLELAIDADRQALVSKLIDDVEHAVLAAIMGTILDEVVGPDVVGMLRPQPDTGAVREPKSAAFRLLPGNFKPLAPPDSSTRPSLTDQPAWRSKAATLR